MQYSVIRASEGCSTVMVKPVDSEQCSKDERVRRKVVYKLNCLNSIKMVLTLFQTNFIITQLAMFDLLLRFDLHWRPSSGTECSVVTEEGRRWWLKRRSKSNIANCVIMQFLGNNILPT